MREGVTARDPERAAALALIHQLREVALRLELAAGERRLGVPETVFVVVAHCCACRPSRTQSARRAAMGSIEAARRAGNQAASAAAAPSSATTPASVAGSCGAVWKRNPVMIRAA